VAVGTTILASSGCGTIGNHFDYDVKVNAPENKEILCKSKPLNILTS
jgi:hypothetical protein